MKKIKLRSVLLLSIFLLGVIGIYGCKKDRIEPPLKEYVSPNEYLDSKKQEEQEFIIDNDTSTSPIVGNQGTTIYPAGTNCLMFPNGDSVTLPFSVKLIELYTAKDMMYAQVSTVSSDTILETEGEVRVRAFKDGTELILRPGCSYPLMMPSAFPKTYMQVFYGFNESPLVDWTNNLSQLGITPSQSPYFSSGSGHHSANIEKPGWINCGIKRGSSDNSILTFESTTDDLTNVAIFAYLSVTKTVMQVSNVTSGSIPNGSGVDIVAIGIDGSGDIFSFNTSMAISGSSTVNIKLEKTTDADLTSLLNGL